MTLNRKSERLGLATGAPTRERGAALVEMALVMPVLMVLLVGMVTAGIAYDRNNSLNNGARESARFGATLPVTSTLSSWLNDVANVAVESASGVLDSSAPGQQVCVAYVYPDGTSSADQTTRIIELSGVRAVTIGSTCFADGRPNSERRVQVTLQRKTDIEAIVFSSTVTLNAQSVTRFERGSS